MTLTLTRSEVTQTNPNPNFHYPNENFEYPKAPSSNPTEHFSLLNRKHNVKENNIKIMLRTIKN